MPIKITLDEAKIDYRHVHKKSIFFETWMFRLFTMIPFQLPFAYKGVRGLLGQIGNTIKISPETIENQLGIHRKRLELQSGLFFIIIYSYLFLFSFILALFQISYGYTYLIFITLNAVGFVIAGRVAAILLDRRFADSLILVSSLYLVIDLQRHNNLSDPVSKRDILFRIRVLRRNVLLLTQTFADTTVGDNQESVNQLRSIEAYIREREDWVITPKKNTLELLRKDFEKLAILLINGQYGEFKSTTKDDPNKVVSPPLTFTDKLLRTIGFVLPYLLLLVLYLQPEYIKNIGVDINTAFLVAISWILLTIDVGLKLGLVAQFTGLVKTVRELR